MISRRRFVAGTLATVGGLAAGGLGGLGGLAGCESPSRNQTAALLPSRTPLPERFAVPFVVPPVKRPRSRADGVTRYAIVQQTAQQEIIPGLSTEIMGYDGLLPGPTIRARRGERVVVTHANTLDVPTVVHLHGGHTPAASDGWPVDLVLPASGGERYVHHGGASGDVTVGSRSYTYPNDQPAATLWYHDHRMDFTGPQVWRGMAGLYLLTDDEEEGLPLPAGDRDVPLVIMDRSFAEDGSLLYPSIDQHLLEPPGVTDGYVAGVLGDVLLVNGRPWPELEVDAARYRLRIVNASNARRYRLALDPAAEDRPLVQIGSDGGLLQAPVRHQQVVVAPAERFDLVVDFGRYPPGSVVTLTNALGTGSTDAVMRFRVGRRVRDDARVPDRLVDVPRLEPAAGAPRREWRFTRGGQRGPAHWVINDQPFDPYRMDARPRLGEVEVWRFYSDLHHPVHVHLSPFQVIGRSGRDPGPYDAGWKDTVDIGPTDYVDVAVRFDDYAGKYLLHCHNLEHEDMMMMATFETVG